MKERLIFSCKHAVDCTGADASHVYDTATAKVNPLLDTAPASFEGLISFCNQRTFFEEFRLICRSRFESESGHLQYDVYQK